MAEVTSGSNLTVMVLDENEAVDLGAALSFAVINGYTNDTVNYIHELLAGEV